MIGFATKLAFNEVQAMQLMDDILHEELDIRKEHKMMYNPKYLGLSDPLTRICLTESNIGEDIVIGVTDSSIPLNHPSFFDDQIPAKPTNYVLTKYL